MEKLVAQLPSPRFSGEREGTHCAAMGRVRGLHQDHAFSFNKPLTPPAALRRGPPLSPLKRGEGCKDASC